MTDFAEQAERYRHELRVHCYRMLGSYDDAEDLVQETYLRAWRARASFEGRSTLRAWLYKIATNACLDTVRRPRVLPYQLQPPGGDQQDARHDLPWLQPFPDLLLDRAEEPDAQVIRRETIELAFLTAIQQLPPKQRAVLIFRDVLGWSAKETADVLDLSVAAANSALQRARPVLRERLPARRAEWSAEASADEQALVAKYMAAYEAGDAAGLAALMHEDVRVTMPPYPFWYSGRATAEEVFAANFEPGGQANRGAWRFVAVGVNRQPAVAAYLQAAGADAFQPFAVIVFRVEYGLVAEMTAFEGVDFTTLGLPDYLASA
ncbi:RNA polymerase subunit sigma-70 [Kribbella sp. NPDC051770]|uniref:RNA polymerase subunit sigma-70 n=1 Tax=Kribbella sp. NPDC051770 TaxID=3155413 RepID=UPI003432B175